MKLIKIKGDLKKIQKKSKKLKLNDFDSLISEPVYAIIEIEMNGLLNQIEYIIYKASSTRYYCNIKRKRVYLDELPCELDTWNI